MQAAGKVDEPGEAARLASLVEKIMRAADEAEKPDEAKRESLAEKKEIKMADEEIEDEAESGEVDDAKNNKVALRQKNDCNKCKMFNECVDYCKSLQKDENDIAPGIWKTCEEACKHHCICKSDGSPIPAHPSRLRRTSRGYTSIARTSQQME